MNEALNRTLVCSVLFIDIVDYSKHDVTEQVRLKHRFNAVLSSALGHVEQEERVVVDTGDGAAIAFRGDPERALYVALEVFDANVDDLPVRMGINLGPVSLMRDINGGDNVIGDGINVAQRIMGFAARGELLVSRSFYEVVSLLSGDYASMFKDEGERLDKHKRSHDVYSVGQAVRVARRWDSRSRSSIAEPSASSGSPMKQIAAPSPVSMPMRVSSGTPLRALAISSLNSFLSATWSSTERFE